MSPAAVTSDPTEHVHTAEKRSFRSELRRRDAEMQSLQEQNFDLKMQVDQLQSMLLQRKEPRRISTSPPPEKYYEFDDDNDSRRSSASTDDIGQDMQNPAMQTLRHEVSILREENKSLTMRNHDLSEALDDLREMQRSEARDAEEKIKAAHRDLQSLVNQVEDLQSENLKYSVEITQTREQLELTKSEMSIITEEKDETEKRYNATAARAEGLQMQFKATISALEESRFAENAAEEKMGLTSIELLKVKQDLEEAQKACDEARKKQAEIVRQASNAADEKETMRVERDTAVAKLEAELERAKLWSEASQLVSSNDLLLAGKPSALEDLVSLLKRQQAVYNQTSMYQPRWREQILGDMNECLRALYRSQKEIELKREQFVEVFAGALEVDSSTQLVSSA